MLEEFLNFVNDIGFVLSNPEPQGFHMIYLSNGGYTISIYNPEEQDKRYSIDLNGKYIETRPKQINFALDDFEVLEDEFKDVIRDNKLKKILHV